MSFYLHKVLIATPFNWEMKVLRLHATENCPKLSWFKYEHGGRKEGDFAITNSIELYSFMLYVSSTKILFIYSILTVSLNLFNKHSSDFLSLKKNPLLNFSSSVSVIFVSKLNLWFWMWVNVFSLSYCSLVSFICSSLISDHCGEIQISILIEFSEGLNLFLPAIDGTMKVKAAPFFFKKKGFKVYHEWFSCLWRVGSGMLIMSSLVKCFS